MTKRCVPAVADGPRRSAELLQRIADALGLPAKAFFTDTPAAAGVPQHGELLRLWSALDSPADRRRVIEFMRMLASGTPHP